MFISSAFKSKLQSLGMKELIKNADTKFTLALMYAQGFRGLLNSLSLT